MGGLVKSIFGGPEMPPVQPAPPAPTNNDAANAAEAERRRQKAAAGRASTDLTGGLLGTAEATTAKKTLLG